MQDSQTMQGECSVSGFKTLQHHILQHAYRGVYIEGEAWQDPYNRTGITSFKNVHYMYNYNSSYD